MPSLRNRFSTYLRQLSFIDEPRSERNGNSRFAASAISPNHSITNGDCFIIKYLEGRITLKPRPDIHHGKEADDLPNLNLNPYDHGFESVEVANTGPNEGLLGIKRARLHLSAGPDIDFIDVNQEPEIDIRQSSSPKRSSKTENNRGGLCNTNRLETSPSQQSVAESESPAPHIIDNTKKSIIDSINWSAGTENVYGVSTSLYERNCLLKEETGNPIADCYGIIARGNSVILALADGVNWGDGSRMAARAAIQGSLDYLNTVIFDKEDELQIKRTHDVFTSLLRAFWEAHACILEVGGFLTTLTIAIVLPLGDNGKSVVCCCNVGDSLAYIYSQESGVRELTQGSHDITSNRDMRDALGALGPCKGLNPELGNLTLSMSVVEPGDIVFITSDGISDNFDPVVGKFADIHTSSIQRTESEKSKGREGTSVPKRSARNQNRQSENLDNMSNVHNNNLTRPKFLRSHTVMEPRRKKVNQPTSPVLSIPRSPAGLPLVTGAQRHALSLLRLEDLLCYGINGTMKPCTSARKLCHLLMDFTKMITAAKRNLLEQRELFYKVVDGPDGIKREYEMNKIQHRSARKKMVQSSVYSSLPGKLDHATVVAYTIGSRNTSPDVTTRSCTKASFDETNL